MSLISAQNRIDAMMRAEIESIRAELAAAKEKLKIAMEALEWCSISGGDWCHVAEEALEKIK